MKIDLTPKLEQANDTDAICIKMRDIEALYVIRLANGKDYTTKFSKKELDEFQPNKTVSEMISIWEKGIKRRYDIAKNAIETGLHPHRTFERPIMISGTNIKGEVWEIPSGKTERVRSNIDSYEKRSFKREMNDREMEFGSMVFIKIC
jgi:hypothetical protein